MSKRIGTLSLFVLSVGLFAQGNSDRVRTLNQRVLQLHGAMQRATPAEAAQLRSQAGPVLAERAAALESLIKDNPAAALGLAFAEDLLADLSAKFPASAANIEKQGTWSGVSNHVVFDDVERKTRSSSVQLRNGTDTVTIYSANGEPHCVSGNVLEAKGVRVNNSVAAQGTTVKTGSVAAAGGCNPLGLQNSAVLMVQFPGVPLPSTITPAGLNDIFFASSGRSVNTFWQEASNGKASAAGQIFGPYTLDRVYSCAEYSEMRYAAIQAADADVNFQNFTRLFIVFPNPGSCGWAGLGTLGCAQLSSADGAFNASTSWLMADYMGSRDNGVKLATHEGGHNLTLHHASSRDFGAEALGALGTTGTLSEYGDPFSTLGSWNFGHYAVPHKVRIGWIAGSNVVTAESNGTYTLQPVESPTAGVQALKVRRGTGNNAWLWVEYRQPTGAFHSTLGSQISAGGLIHYEDSITGTYTHLLDFTTASSGFGDAHLVGGWVDPYSNLSLNVTGGGTPALSVGVNYGTVPCARTAPTVTVNPPNPSTAAGTSTTYQVSILNNDTSGCAATTYALSTALPSGWSTVFSPATLTVTPGQTAAVTMTKTVPAGFTPGTYPVDASAASPDHATVNSLANVTVTAPALPIAVALSASATTVAVRGTVTLRATVTNANGPVTGASVTFTVTRPGGSTSTSTAVTGSTGAVSWNYRAQQRGTYTVKATGNSNGLSASSSSLTFTAN